MAYFVTLKNIIIITLFLLKKKYGLYVIYICNKAYNNNNNNDSIF